MRIVDQDLVGVAAGENEVAAVAVHGHGGQRCPVQTVERCFDRPGLQAEMLGSQQDFGLAERRAGHPELMRKLLRVSRKLVKAREHDEAGQAAVQRGWCRGHFDV